jgi:hypothetical protein
MENQDWLGHHGGVSLMQAAGLEMMVGCMGLVCVSGLPEFSL